MLENVAIEVKGRDRSEGKIEMKRCCRSAFGSDGLRAVACVSFVTLLFMAVGCASGPASPAEVTDPSQAVFAAPGGWNGGDGTKEKPWDLGTALSGSGPIRPGGTVWLLGGTFKGAFVSNLTGTEQAPIVVRPVPGARVIIDGRGAAAAALTVNGAWTIYRDFEITNSDPRRTGANLRRHNGVDVRGPNTKFVNLVVHDLGGGLGMFSDAVDAEAYGNIIYHNGWVSDDRAQGHGIYTQNKTGIRRITDNVVFSQFGMGIHAYGSDEAFLDDIQLEGNAVFNNGITAGDFNILLGGHSVAKRPVLKENYTYDKPGAGNNIGYEAGCQDLMMQGNYFANITGGYAVQLVNCAGTLDGNVIVGHARGIEGKVIRSQPELAALYKNNTYSERQTGTKAVVRPNRYEPGRAHIIVYNWDLAKSVSVDLTSVGLQVGQSYEIRDVQNLASSPVANGTYSGIPVTIPVDGLTVADVVGWPKTPPHTAPQFAVFLITSSTSTPSGLSSFFARMRGLVGF